MRPYPVIARAKLLEIGYQGHVRWQSRLTDGTIQAPTVIDKFHLFSTFLLKRPSPTPDEYGKKSSVLYEGEWAWELCTITPEARIQLTYDIALTGNKKIFLEQTHPYTTYMPPNPHEFFTFVDWKILPIVKYPIPVNQRENAIKAAIIYLQQMQYTMDAYMLYWDTEGRPPVSQLEQEEVFIKYGNAARSRSPE